MNRNISQKLQNKYCQEFDEKEDIILPDTYWREIVYIVYILADIIKTRTNIRQKLFELKRQIKIHHKWMKVK